MKCSVKTFLKSISLTGAVVLLVQVSKLMSWGKDVSHYYIQEEYTTNLTRAETTSQMARYTTTTTTTTLQSSKSPISGIVVGEIPPCKTFVDQDVPLCPDHSPDLRGKLNVAVREHSFQLLEEHHGKDLLPGGMFRPEGCVTRQRVAIIVPYRDRDTHLKILLNNLIPMMKRQMVEYMIFVVEQAPGTTFNRGMVKNIGYLEAKRLCDFDCYFFHDIDQVPEDDRNIYTCDVMPRHHAAAITRYKYRLPYNTIFGGVVSFSRNAFETVNGYSNLYIGWGAEDDDLYNRIKAHGMQVVRYPMDISRYKDLSHIKDKKNSLRKTLLSNWEDRSSSDGLNSVKYERYVIEFRKLFTWVYVGVNQTDLENQINNITIHLSSANKKAASPL